METAHKIERILRTILDKIRWPAAGLLILMALMTTVDVTGRALFSHPLRGDNEIQEVMMLLIVFLSAGYCTYMGQQASADVVIVHLPKRTRAIVETVTWSLCAIIFGLISWNVAKIGWVETINPLNRATMLLRIPYGPFILVAALGCIFVCISSLVNCYRSIIKAQSRKDIES